MMAPLGPTLMVEVKHDILHPRAPHGGLVAVIVSLEAGSNYKLGLCVECDVGGSKCCGNEGWSSTQPNSHTTKYVLSPDHHPAG